MPGLIAFPTIVEQSVDEFGWMFANTRSSLSAVHSPEQTLPKRVNTPPEAAPPASRVVASRMAVRCALTSGKR